MSRLLARQSPATQRAAPRSLAAAPPPRRRRPAALPRAAVTAGGGADAEAEASGSDSEEEEEEFTEEDFRRWRYEPLDAGAPHGPPALILAGWYIEELAATRVLLDGALEGGTGVALIPATPALLEAPVGLAFQSMEPDWGAPVPADWVHGGGWGAQRTIAFSGLAADAQAAVLAALEAGGVPDVRAVVAGAEDERRPLGELLAEAAPVRRGGAGAAAAPVAFVPDLPPVGAAVDAARAARADAAAAAAAEAAAPRAPPRPLADDELDLIDELAGGGGAP
jgi:hypothetical protein